MSQSPIHPPSSMAGRQALLPPPGGRPICAFHGIRAPFDEHGVALCYRCLVELRQQLDFLLLLREIRQAMRDADWQRWRAFWGIRDGR
jgi:hypothetical protein